MPVAAGATNLFFSRDTKVYLKAGDDLWEIPVMNGYAFSQSTNTSEVTLNEMADSAGNSRRGRKMFTDSFAPSEWSFDTYIRPYKSASGLYHHAVEEALWALFAGGKTFTPEVTGASPTPPAWDNGVAYSGTDLEFNFTASNKVTLGTFELYFVLGAANAVDTNYEADGDTTIYRTTGNVINEAGLNFEIDGLAMISWSGMGGNIEEVASFDASAAITGGISATDNFIRNRLTALDAVSSISGASVTYDLTLTGGSITISNNVSFLTPEVLGRVNQPVGHVTGTRSVSGSFTCYLDEKTNGSIDLVEDLQGATTAITNKFALDFYVGGKASADTPTAPGMQVKMGQAHLELPSIQMDDVIAVEVNFHALPSTIGATDEVSVVRYVAA